MNILEEKKILNNGTAIPLIGLGTWQISNETAIECIKEAIEAGYRHIDTAQMYGNEEGVGQGIINSGIKRDELFITSKIDSQIKDYDSTKKSIAESLNKLKTNYIDLMLIHWPRPRTATGMDNSHPYYQENIEVYRAMEDAYREGKLKAIGVSNFMINDLENILDNCHIIPAVNQIEMHIGYLLNDVIDYCNKNNIAIEAYSPIATGKLLTHAGVKAIAEKLNVSVARLSIAYVLEKGAIALPKTTHKEYMYENANINFKLTEEDIKSLEDLGAISRK